jgi:hypothetical protein
MTVNDEWKVILVTEVAMVSLKVLCPLLPSFASKTGQLQQMSFKLGYEGRTIYMQGSTNTSSSTTQIKIPNRQKFLHENRHTSTAANLTSHNKQNTNSSL